MSKSMRIKITVFPSPGHRQSIFPSKILSVSMFIKICTFVIIFHNLFTYILDQFSEYYLHHGIHIKSNTFMNSRVNREGCL